MTHTWLPILLMLLAAMGLGAVMLTVNTLQSAPRESLLGLLAIVAGVPAYLAWRRAATKRGGR